MSDRNQLATKLRLIAATAEDMAEKVAAGRYWSDDVAQACAVIGRANDEARQIAQRGAAGDR